MADKEKKLRKPFSVRKKKEALPKKGEPVSPSASEEADPWAAYRNRSIIPKEQETGRRTAGTEGGSRTARPAVSSGSTGRKAGGTKRASVKRTRTREGAKRAAGSVRRENSRPKSARSGAGRRLPGADIFSARRKTNRPVKKKPVLSREEKQKRMKTFLLAGGIAAVLLVTVYCLIAGSYRHKFMPNTYINGFSVGRLSVDDTEVILKDSVEDYKLEIGFRGGTNRLITSKDIALTYVSSNEVEKLMANQKRLGWLGSVLGRKSVYTVGTGFQFDEGKLRSVLEGLPEFQSDAVSEPQAAHIVKTPERTFRIAAEFEGNAPDESVVFEAVTKAINASEPRISLSRVEGAYKAPSRDASNETLAESLKDLNEFLDTDVTIVRRDGSTQLIDRYTTIDWVDPTEDGNYEVTEPTVWDRSNRVMVAIANEFDDTKDWLPVETTNLGTVYEKCLYPYGYKVDTTAETDKLAGALLRHESGEVAIENSVQETPNEKIGDTYIEVDITNQRLYYYKGGEIVMASDIVSGLEKQSNRRTPSGVYSINNKKRDMILGSYEITGYESHVNYWLPFYGSYGLHDATWRGSFGGDIYTYAGSHGCVNLPYSFAEKLYNAVDYWTPVLVVREGDNYAAEERANLEIVDEADEYEAGESEEYDVMSDITGPFSQDSPADSYASQS